MVRIAYNASKKEMSFSGHAGSAEKGKDLICCAVSTLFYTLKRSLEKLHLQVEAEDSPEADIKYIR